METPVYVDHRGTFSTLEVKCWPVKRITPAAVILILLLSSGCSSDRELSRAMQVPENLQKARAVTGAGRFRKELFYSQAALGVVTDIRNRADSNAGGQLVVVGQGGAAFLTTDASTERVVHFDSDLVRGSEVVLVSKNNSSPEFLSRGSWLSDVVVMDSSGKPLWKHGGSFWNGVDDAAAGDLNGDGKTEYVVGFNGGKGLDLLDASGKKIWNRSAANVWSVAVVQAATSQESRIIHSDASGRLIVRGSDGNVKGEYRLPVYVSQFSLSPWNDQVPVAVVTSDSDLIYVSSLSGEILARLPAPDSVGKTFRKTKATTVVFPGKRSYYTVLQRYSLWGRSILYLYNGLHQLVYEEVLDEQCGTVVPYESSLGVQLLVGCNGKVWSYKPKMN